MLDINILKKSGHFKEVILKKGEVLFNEGENDNNIYILLVGELSVEKYTSNKKDETKILAYLKKNDIFGEAALNTDSSKEVSIKAKTWAVLLSIDAKKGLSDFSIKYQNEALELLKYIIFLSNKRLSEANYLITSTYKISKEIIELDEVSNKTIFGLIEKLKESINVSDIMYYEANPVLDNYITLKYDTRKSGKLLNEIIELTNSKLDLLDLKNENYFNLTQKLSIGNNNLGYLIFLKKDEKFNDSDKKVLAITSTSIAGLIKQKQLLDEERDKEFMEE